MPKAAATAASNAATTMRNRARAITLPRQRAGRRAIGLVGCIAELSAPCPSPPRPPDASDSGSALDGRAGCPASHRLVRDYCRPTFFLGDLPVTEGGIVSQ